MRSVLVEVLRNGSASREGIMQPDARYFVTRADEPAYLAETGLTFREYRQRLRKLDDGEAADRGAAIAELSEVVTKLLRSDSFDWRRWNGDDADSPLQVDLVLNPAELSGLPFEVALGGTGQYLFRERPPLIVTRRLRGAFRNKRDDWPVTPRTLFAWASPPGAGAEVPHGRHLDVLLDVLGPWITRLESMPQVPDYRAVLTVLDRATLSALQEACEARDYTYIHILAHGIGTGPQDDPIEQRWGLAFHSPDGNGIDTVTPEALADALAPATGAVAVTLASCFGGSQSNSLIPEGGLAHVVHERGVPIVVGSQWPLTFDGSVMLARTFYHAIVHGQDARLALHGSRQALFGCPECQHDWASLVGYVSLPEGYADYRLDVLLARQLAALRTASASADLLLASDSPADRDLAAVADKFRRSAEALERTLDHARKERRAEVLSENYGLLGSAFKRLGELLHHWNERLGATDERRRQGREALEASHRWYRAGFDDDVSAHWLAVQALSLETVLYGRIRDPLDWDIALRVAERAADVAGEYWAWGSVLELRLLAPAAGRPADEAPANLAVDRLNERARADGIVSTRRQLRRYTRWWTSANGFFPGSADLAKAAARLEGRLRPDDSPPVTPPAAPPSA